MVGHNSIDFLCYTTLEQRCFLIFASKTFARLGPGEICAFVLIASSQRSHGCSMIFAETGLKALRHSQLRVILQTLMNSIY